MAGDTGSAIVVGLIGTAIGVLAVDYAFSSPGTSWVSKLTSGLPGFSPAVIPPALPRGYAASRSPRSPLARSSSGPMARRPLPMGPPPLTVTPAMVNQIAVKINSLLHTNLPANGLVTEDMKRAITSLQSQFGLQPTGFPDEKTLQALGIQAGVVFRNMAKAPPIKEAGNFISKTFGGPPSSHATGPDEGVRKVQHMLNTFYGHQIIDEDGIMGSNTSGLLSEFQKAQGLPNTAIIDSKTQDSLAKIVSSGVSAVNAALDSRTGYYLAGADSGVSTWKSETQSLGDAAQNIIAKVMSEGDQRKLQPLSKMLKLAGFPVTATAVSSVHGATATTGWW